MKTQRPQKDHNEVFGSIAIVALLVLTAWGNAIAMLVVSIVGLIAGFFLYRNDLFRGHSLVTMIGFIAAGLIALAISLGLAS